MNKLKIYCYLEVILISLLIVILFLNISGNAETIIYDNITSSQYKYITLDELDVLGLIGNDKYEVLLNNYFIGYYTKNDKIFYPDNSNLTIIIPSKIKTSTNDIWELNIKPMLFTMIGFILTWGLLILIICYVIYLIQRKIRKGY